jgi:hypothetical protein
MKRLVVVAASAVVVASVMIFAGGFRDARADTAEGRPAAVPSALDAAPSAPAIQDPAIQADNEPAASPARCDVAGLTPVRARSARPSRHEILWNPVDVAELVRSEDLLVLKLEGAGGVLRGERAYPLTELEVRRRSQSRRYPLEARFIHENAAGDRVVVGLYLTEGEANPAIEPLRAVAENADAEAIDGVDLRALLPDAGSHLKLAARTDPGCSENVVWTVLDQPIEASREQLAALEAPLERASAVN